jgi:hypothetical protein
VPQLFVHGSGKLALHVVGKKSDEVLALTHGNADC